LVAASKYYEVKEEAMAGEMQRESTGGCTTFEVVFASK
jgi:hypothetical protein